LLSPELPLSRLSEDQELKLKSSLKEASENKPSEDQEFKQTSLMKELPLEDQDWNNKPKLPSNIKNKH
jgi:hypothetical protein